MSANADVPWWAARPEILIDRIRDASGHPAKETCLTRLTGVFSTLPQCNLSVLGARPFTYAGAGHGHVQNGHQNAISNMISDMIYNHFSLTVADDACRFARKRFGRSFDPECTPREIRSVHT